jgi:hypothetical protein
MSDKRIVAVEWLDAGCDSAWQGAGSLVTPVTCWTVGWLWHEDESMVLIVGTCNAAGDFNQSMAIPRGMVLTLKDVGTP